MFAFFLRDHTPPPTSVVRSWLFAVPPIALMFVTEEEN